MSNKWLTARWRIGELNALVKNLGEETARKIQLGELKLDSNMLIGINTYLTRLSPPEGLIIPATDDSKVIPDTEDMFVSIDSDFHNWKADEASQATSETTVDVYEMKQNGTYSQLFGSLSNDVKKLCLTQSQIISFVQNHSNWLRKDGYATFFLFESYGHLLVASVGVAADGLGVRVGRFGGSGVFFADSRHRLVVPQLT